MSKPSHSTPTSALQQVPGLRGTFGRGLRRLFHMTDCGCNLASLCLERLRPFSQMKSSSPEWRNQALPVWLSTHTHVHTRAHTHPRTRMFLYLKGRAGKSNHTMQECLHTSTDHVWDELKYTRITLAGFKENPSFEIIQRNLDFHVDVDRKCHF